MPKRVDRVPNDWTPYMDGHIWEFTDAEWRQMEPYRPMSDSYDGSPIGPRCIYWGRKGMMYVRFFDSTNTLTVDELAMDES